MGDGDVVWLIILVLLACTYWQWTLGFIAVWLLLKFVVEPAATRHGSRHDDDR